MVNVVPDLRLYCVTFHCVLCYWCKSSDFPEVDFSTFSSQRRKIYGASSFSAKTYRKDGGTELQETVMSGVKTGMCWYNILSEPPVQTSMLHGRHHPIWPPQWAKQQTRRRRNEPEKAILSGEFAVFLVCAREFICLRIFLCTYVCMWRDIHQ